MTIDTERLKTDAAYWRECGAPEDATHVGNRWDKQPERGFKPCWYKKSEGFAFMYPEHGKWVPCANGAPSHEPAIPRPTKTAAPGWDGQGLPPVGCECEASLKEGDRWSWCKVLGVHKESDSIWILESDGEPITFELSAYKFRPIRAKELRQRDDLKDLIIDAIHHNDSGYAAHIADAILSRYNLEPKQ